MTSGGGERLLMYVSVVKKTNKDKKLVSKNYHKVFLNDIEGFYLRNEFVTLLD